MRYSVSFYPRELFSINEDRTRRNIREYERKYDKWNSKARELFPDYDSMNILERIKLRPQIDAAAGFSI